MEHILELYQKPYDPRHPLVCFDEKSVQLLAHITTPLALQPGQAIRQDYEYKRNGTRNLFLFVEPKVGARQVLVTNPSYEARFCACHALLGRCDPSRSRVHRYRDG